MTQQNPACDPDCTCPLGTCKVEEEFAAQEAVQVGRDVMRFLLTATDRAWAEFLNTLVGQPRDLTPYVKALRDEP